MRRQGRINSGRHEPKHATTTIRRRQTTTTRAPQPLATGKAQGESVCARSQRSSGPFLRRDAQPPSSVDSAGAVGRRGRAYIPSTGECTAMLPACDGDDGDGATDVRRRRRRSNPPVSSTCDGRPCPFRSRSSNVFTVWPTPSRRPRSLRRRNRDCFLLFAYTARTAVISSRLSAPQLSIVLHMG